MAWIIKGIVTGLIGKYIKLGTYAAKYGISMARSILSRAAANLQQQSRIIDQDFWMDFTNSCECS